MSSTALLRRGLPLPAALRSGRNIHPNRTKGAQHEPRKKCFEKFPKKWPKGPFGKPVRGERGNHDLPSGAKVGENMDLEHHYRHKQHTFDAFRAVSLEACFTCTGTAAYKYIQISAVLSSVQANGDILRQQLVFRLILVGIFLVDRTSRAPFS